MSYIIITKCKKCPSPQSQLPPHISPLIPLPSTNLSIDEFSSLFSGEKKNSLRPES